MIQEDQYRSLGASGIRVSPLGIGTNQWEFGKNDEAVFQVVQSSLDAGVNFFDTAEVYCEGKSERLLGACIKRDGRPVVIATKFAPTPTRLSPRLSRRHFMDALDGSLSRLGVQTIDLYYIHWPFSCWCRGYGGALAAYPILCRRVYRAYRCGGGKQWHS